MSLDLSLRGPEEDWKHRCTECWQEHAIKHRPTLFSKNITHNLGPMFEEAGVYKILWHGDGLVAKDCIPAIKEAVRRMEAEPDRFRKFDSPNGWGLYVHALPWLKEVLQGFIDNPDGVLDCSR